MIKAIIFDADGVLLECERFSTVLERDYGISMEMTKEFFQGPFKVCRTGGADLKEVVAPFLPKWGWDKGVDAFLETWFNVDYKLNQPLLNYIQDLRAQGTKCFIATNQEKRRFDYFSKKLGFKDAFDKVYVSAHLGVAKPDREFFEKMYSELSDISKNEVLFIDDTQVNVKAAEEFGFHAEFWQSFQNFKDKLGALNAN